MEQRFIVKQKPLISILSSMQPICTKRTTLDTTSSILFQVGHKELVLKSTDLEISLQSSYLFEGSTIQEPISFLVSGKRMYDLVKELDGEIVCTLEENQLTLNADGVKLSLNIKNSREFPPFPERIENLMQLNAHHFLEIVNKVAFLIPQNNANPALNGLLLEISPTHFKMTATDGHCLAQVQTNNYTLEEQKSWLLPRRAIFELKKILETAQDTAIFLGICGNQLVFSGEYFNFFTKLLNDTFPQYSSILDKATFMPARVDRGHLIKTLRRSSCLLSGQFIATRFEFGSSKLQISMHNKEVGNQFESIPIDGLASELDLRFYAPYLLNGLQVFQEPQILFHLKNGSKPIIFESIHERYTMIYLVMPVSPTHA